MFGGTWDLEQQGLPNFDAHMADSFSFGVAGGFLFDDAFDDCAACNLIEFRWLRQNTHLELKQNPLVPTPVTFSAFHPALTLNYFLSDFTHEWALEDAKMIKPFLTASLGAALTSTPASSAPRFVFGIGTGDPAPGGVPAHSHACGTSASGLHSGLRRRAQRGVMNQFELSAGPAFRF